MKSKNTADVLGTSGEQRKTRKNAIVEYLDYQIPVTQLNGEKMRHLPAVYRFKRYGR